MPWVEVNNIKLYYEESGSGQPLLLLMGLGYPSGMWFRQVPELSQRFRVIVLDNRGVGRSDKPDEPYTIELMASDAAGLLDALGLKGIGVAGVSMGGYIAQTLARLRPELVGRLALLATSAGGPRFMELTRNVWQELAKLAGLPPEEIIRGGMALAVTPEFFASRLDLIERSVRVRLAAPQPLYAWSRQFTASSGFDGLAQAGQITQPTLILAGARDQVMPLVLTQELAVAIPQARLIVYPDSGHLLFLEKAAEVNQVLTEFFG
ncbi:MAG: alpha/beta hydrolase [Thermodesulfobacteriota bacterium]